MSMLHCAELILVLANNLKIPNSSFSLAMAIIVTDASMTFHGLVSRHLNITSTFLEQTQWHMACWKTKISNRPR